MFRNKHSRSLHLYSIVFLSCILLNTWNLSGQSVSRTAKKWVATWSTGVQLVETRNNPPSPGLTDNTLRQVVRVSIGGEVLRVKFSNEYSKSPVTMHSVQIAASAGGSVINQTTNIILTFNGSKEFTMDPGTAITSDPVAFKLQPRMDVAITIYFGGTSADITGHPGSRTTSYILSGNKAFETDLSGSVITEHWYAINGIDVQAPSTSSCVAILGNSITDGRG